MAYTESWDDNYLGITWFVTVGMQLVFFAIAATCKFDKVTDLAGSANFVLLAWLTYCLRETYHTRQLIITLLVTVWGVRLGGYLLYRVLQRGKDERFDEIRENFWSFLGFWVYQMVWVWVTSLPVTFLNASLRDPDFGIRDYVGWALWGIGMFFEVSADFQKDRHSNDPSKKGQLLSSGVWYYSRHPNYFGEITIWLGVFIACSPVFESPGGTEWGYISAFSPILTILLLLFLSGAPLGEERYDKRYGNNPEYVAYKKSTSPFIPMPPCLYAALPSCMQLLCCCEFPFYSKHFAGNDQNGIKDNQIDSNDTEAPKKKKLDGSELDL